MRSRYWKTNITTASETDGADADLAVAERDAGGQQRRRELDGSTVTVDRRKLADRRAVVDTCGATATSAKLSELVSHEYDEHDGGEAEAVASPGMRIAVEHRGEAADQRELA